MIYLKSFSESSNLKYRLFEGNRSEQKIHKFCSNYNIENYTINPDLSIDVNVDLDLFSNGLTKLPIKFNRVIGDFYCDNNHLTSFENFPKYIGGNLHCQYNDIRTFEEFPYIGGSFECKGNLIYELWFLFQDHKLIELFNDYDIIREKGRVIILDHLNEFLREIGRDSVNKVYGYNCI